MSKPEDVPQDVWDEATQHVAQIPIRSQRAWDRSKSIIARAIMAAEKRGEEREREACALHLEMRGEGLYVDYEDKVGNYLCEDMARELRNRTTS